MFLDHWIAALLGPLALWVLINGTDDLLIDFAALASVIRRRFSRDPRQHTPTEAELDAVAPRRMAIFVAVWKEHRVIQKMIDNNVTRLRYPLVEFFIGAYPNDGPTIAAIHEAMRRYPNVHIALTPHDGPSSKADNLNWIFQRMLIHEEEHGVRFEMILTHDAEDMIDPDALRWINYYAQWHDMVQIPVLALPTPVFEMAHGVYCDEFAEFQFKDMPARQIMGGFIPSNGVGTGFSRNALERLAAAHQNRIFEPGCLTEDYENGWRIHRLGMKQKFIPISFRDGRPIATREYFPRSFRTAIRQRSRWVLGITLQSWEFHSARETLAQLYWFWRDRKGLIGNLATPATNVLFVLGAVTWTASKVTGHSWELAREMSRLFPIYLMGLGLQILHTTIRAVCSWRVYGLPFAYGVPLRVLAGNWINFCATWIAIRTYVMAKITGRPLRWAKTEHNYPSRAGVGGERRTLGEILTGSQWITNEQLNEARKTRPVSVDIGEHLISMGLISEQDLYLALALQHNLPLGIPGDEDVSVPVTRALPSSVAKKWKVLPFRISAGEMFLAGAKLPGEDMQRDIKRFSSLEIRFHLITPTEFKELAGRYLD